MKVTSDDTRTIITSPEYNLIFNKINGDTVRWGRSLGDDPQWCPFGPELLDLEISVDGCPNACPYCYKDNKSTKPHNMSLATFRAIMDRMPSTLTQVAFGITGVQANPDFVSMLEECRTKYGVIPNYTMTGADLTDEIAAASARWCGGVAVSAHPNNPILCTETVERLIQAGVGQVNIHYVLYEDSYFKAYGMLETARRIGAHAVVFLALKPKGRAAKGFKPVRQEAFGRLVNYALDRGLPVGFDSCSAPKFFKATTNARLHQMAEPCESGLFSAYINVDGVFFPCSFNEGEYSGVDVLQYDSFDAVWQHPLTSAWRAKLLSNGRSCPTFKEA